MFVTDKVLDVLLKVKFELPACAPLLLKITWVFDPPAPAATPEEVIVIAPLDSVTILIFEPAFK